MSAEIRKKAKSFKQKVLEDAVAGLHTNLLLLGENLGLFDVLVANVPMTSDELAVAANINKRYCQEWCLHMAATHVLSVDAASNKFQLQEGVAEALKDTATLSITNTMAAAIQNPERLQRAYQTGEGIGWGDHHKLLHIGTRRFFTPLYENALIPNLPNRVKEILEAGGSLLDVGCGEGVSSCVFGSAFPNATIHGVDFHGLSPTVYTIMLSWFVRCSSSCACFCCSLDVSRVCLFRGFEKLSHLHITLLVKH
eukprot:m.160803 g.160803  ORF g.160803 m.160803 type:complete len:253 (-) comp31201_c0_seq3:629-1387(-)